MEREPSSSQDDADDSISRLLGQWGGEGTVEERLASRLGADSLAEVELEHEEPATERVGALLDALHLRGGAFGRYRIKDEIGRGGMGVVVRLWDSELKRHLAMKVALTAREGVERDARTIARFLEEAQVTAQLDHPGIVPVHELGLDSDGHVYFTMRLVKGESLATVFDRAREGRDGWTQTRVLDVLLKACEALAYAHSRGVIHRDLKPANVMVGAFGEVYVMDWGLAKVLGRDDPDLSAPRIRDESDASAIVTDLGRTDPESPLATLAGHALGTPAYMAPEQARGDLAAIGRQSDVYAMGAILYELLCGAAPYAEPRRKLEPREVLARVLSGPPRPLRETARSAAPELVAIADKAMQREPADRYADMRELLGDLRAYQESRPGRAWRDTALRRTVKLVRRNPTRATGVLACALAAVALLAGVTAREVQARNRVLSIRDREQRLVRSVNELYATENTRAYDQVAQMNTFADAALRTADLLGAFGVRIGESRAAAELAQSLRSQGSELARRKLVEALLLEARFLGLSGLAQAAYYASHGGATGPLADDWRRMAENHPLHVALWSRIAETIAALGDYPVSEMALRSYETWLITRTDVLDLSPTLMAQVHAEEREFLGFVVERVRAPGDAVAFLELSLRDDPTLLWSHVRLWKLWTELHDASRALAHAMAAVALWPEGRSTHLSLAMSLEAIEDRDGARNEYERVVAIDPKYADAWSNYGNFLQRIGEFDRAIECQERACALGPDDHEYHYNLGSALRELAEQTGSSDTARRAIDSYRRVTELQPKFWQGFYFLGRAQQLVPDDSAAIESFERGLALSDHGRGEDLRTALARSLWRVGRQREAVAYLTALLREIPGSEEAQLVWHETVEQMENEQQRQQYEQLREEVSDK